MFRCLLSAMVVLNAPSFALATEAMGTKGQNFDRIVFEADPGEAVELTARVMTINRFANSSSTISATDNGERVLSSESSELERWSRKISVRGQGRHEVVLRCQGVNASPVYCGLTIDKGAVRQIE